jgi:hypothetical protein
MGRELFVARPSSTHEAAISRGAPDTSRMSPFRVITRARSNRARVYCWGSNEDHVFGASLPPTLPAPTHIPALDGSTDLAMSSDEQAMATLCALRNVGELWCPDARERVTFTVL